MTKYIVEKYDEQWTGRKITMDWAYVNPLTGYVYFNNLKVFESDVDSIFLSVKSVGANLTMWKLLLNTYEISTLTLNHPRGTIIQHKKVFNFIDLIDKFTPAKKDTTVSGVHFNILNVKIKNGEFHFLENQIPVNYFIKEVNFESTGKRWDTDTITGTFSFTSGIGNGTMKGNFTINLKNDDYRYDVVIHKFDLNIIGQYLKDLTNYGSFSASVDANIKANGNFADEQNVTLKGKVEINDFHFGKNSNDDYMSFENFTMKISDVSPLKGIYLFDSISLYRPYFKYELYDKTDNLETMFGKEGANVYAVASDRNRFNLIIEIARYVKVMVRNFFQSYYKINRLAIYEGKLSFNDYTLSELFSADFNPINFIADSINKNHNRVQALLTSGIQPYGDLTINLDINPKDTADFDMKYNFQNISAAMFNPYFISYTSFPLDRGKIELNGTWKLKEGEILSVNHLLVIDPRVSKRVKNKNNAWLPLPLIFSFLREKGNVIDYEIPITGKLRDPRFHLNDVILDVLENIFVKPMITRYRREVKYLEKEIENYLTLKWSPQQKELLPEQEDFVHKISEFLADNPKASIRVYPMVYAEKEKENILLYQAKINYFLSLKGNKDLILSESDSEYVNTLSVKSPLFLSYLNKHISDTLLFTIQDKCRSMVEPTLVNSRFKQLNKERENAFRFFFNKNNVINQVYFETSKNIIPYNGFSFYKIEYTGELPKSLIKAYNKLQGLNEETPRNKYERKHKLYESVSENLYQ